MSTTDRAFASQVFASLDKVGAKPPAAVTESWQQTQLLSEKVRALGIRPESVYAAIADALQRGDDPTLDAEVQRILVASQISNDGVTSGVDEIAYSRFRAVVTEHADGIIAAFCKSFDAAAKTLADAHQAFGDVDLTDTDAVLRKGGDAAARWAQATAAVATIDTINQGWTMLAMFAGLAGNNPRYHVLRIAAPTFEQWQTLELAGRKLTAWEALLAGLTLSLPTYTQYRARVATITDGAQQEAAQIEDDQVRLRTGRRPLDRAAAIG